MNVDHQVSGALVIRLKTLEDFPDLTGEDLKACIAFAADHD